MVDHQIAQIAAGQHGLVTAAQCYEGGMTRRMVSGRLDRGILHAVYRGVYAVGHPNLSARGRLLAPVLASGPGAVLSHRSAAAFWGIRQSSATKIDVTSPSRGGRGRDGIAVHRADRLLDCDRELVDGVPVTVVARTIFDLAAVVRRGSVEYAIHRAQWRRLVTPAELRATADRLAGRKGSGIVRAIVDAPAHELEANTRGPAELRFLAICRLGDMPPPRVNQWIALPIASGGLEVDFHWPHARLAVEVDERRTHGTTRAQLNDPARDRALQAAGWTVLRFADRQLDDAARVIATVHGGLGQR